MKSKILNITRLYFIQKINGGYIAAFIDDLDHTYELIFTDKEFQKLNEMIDETIALSGR